MDNIATILNEAKEAINCAASLAVLDQIRVDFLGKKGKLTNLLQQVGKLTPAERPQFGQMVNTIKVELHELLQQRMHVLTAEKLAAAISNQVAIDVTLPGRNQQLGTLHPVTQARCIMEGFFKQMGFSICSGPEIEDEYHNFTALNMPEHHPARDMHDTFYFPNGLLLRTHTSTVQIRAMQQMQPPFRIIVPGRVFRCDSDATHSPMFNQLEGLIVAENMTFANLKWLLNRFLEHFFARKVETRFKPTYFPFTEPSADIYIPWHVNGEKRWLEVLGCGMVHPNVLENCGIDSKRYTGLAFGIGVDRYAMLKYGINDIRLLFENDLQFLRQT